MDSADKPLEKAAFLLFIFAVAMLPLGLGGNRPLPFGLFQMAIAASAILVACDRKVLQSLFLPKRLTFALCGFAAVGVWAVVQTLPLVPENWAHPLWHDAATALGRPLNASIALDINATHQAWLRYITYVLVGILAYVFGQNHMRCQQSLQVLFAVGSVVALYGTALYALDVRQVLWLPKWAHKYDITGTFVDRNHFAVYSGMALICGFGLLWQQFRAIFKNVPEHSYAEAMQKYVLQQGIWRCLSLSVLAIAILFSHSRAGLLSSVAGLLLFTGGYLFYQKRYWLAFVLPGSLAVTTIAVLLTLREHIGRFGRLFIDNSSLDRLKVYTETWRAIETSPWLGYGLGNFETVFRLFRDETIGMNFNHAHSDWLESLFDLGVPFGLILWASIALAITGCLHGIRTRRQHGLYPAVALGASALLLLHATVEFSLQMPGVVVTWLCLLGMGLAQSWGQGERHH